MSLTALARGARIKDAARRAGFPECGFAPAGAPDRFDRFEAALAAGYHGEMTWLARPDAVARRREPGLILPGARTFVMVARRYPAPPDAGGPGRGRVARYARGNDYHDHLLADLAPIVAEIEALGGRARAYTDTGPILEVARAAAAGLGWIGKNTLLLTRQGSWLLLGSILTDLELPPDEPVADRCGSCARCLEACPTAAFPAPRVLDARRCISYLTIEHRGSLPPEVQPLLGDWIFGCDVCQTVCPWNERFAPAVTAPEFEPRGDLAAPDLSRLLELDEAAFATRFAGSPLRRARRRGLLRNVCVALGNAGEPAAVPALARALGDPEPLVREHAARALGRLGGEAARAALAAALTDEGEPVVRAALLDALNGG